jgi:hypothetical protein
MTTTRFDVRTFILIAGTVIALTGLLWIGQGAGLITWPASSFMISNKDWVFYGACVAVVGLFLIGFSRTRR